MKNKDRDDMHRRRREAGSSPDGGDDPDGRAVADALYGGLTDCEPTDEADAAQ
jgi:hypothetical protein